jgi:type I restriction enzyme M protein
LKGRDTRRAHRPPGEILASLGKLEAEIQQGMKELEGMLK